MENNYESWTNFQLYEELVNLGAIDQDVEPYKFWKNCREDMLLFLESVEQIWAR